MTILDWTGRRNLVSCVWISSMLTANAIHRALELGHTICVCHSIYVFAVTDYGNPTALIYVPQSLGASIIIEIALKVICKFLDFYSICIPQ